MIIAYLISLFFLLEYSKAIIYILTNSTPKKIFIFHTLQKKIKNSNSFISFCIIGIVINILTIISISTFSIYFFILVSINIFIIQKLTNIIN